MLLIVRATEQDGAAGVTVMTPGSQLDNHLQEREMSSVVREPYTWPSFKVSQTTVARVSGISC